MIKRTMKQLIYSDAYVNCILDEDNETLFCCDQVQLAKMVENEKIKGVELDDNEHLYLNPVKHSKYHLIASHRNELTLYRPLKIRGKTDGFEFWYHSDNGGLNSYFPEMTISWFISFPDKFSNYEVTITRDFFPTEQLGQRYIDALKKDYQDIYNMTGLYPINIRKDMVFSHNFVDDVLDFSELQLCGIGEANQLFLQVITKKFVFFKTDLSKLSTIYNIFGHTNSIDLLLFTKCFNDLTEKELNRGLMLAFKLLLNPDRFCIVVIKSSMKLFKKALLRDNTELEEKGKIDLNSIDLLVSKCILLGNKGHYLYEIDEDE